MEDKAQVRTLPHSDLDLNLMLTDSVWGRSDVSPELKEKLNRYFSVKDEKGEQLYNATGQPIVTKESLWGLLGFYTRDMRLANLSRLDNELTTCRYYIDLANHFLSVNHIESFLLSLGMAVTILETSQSKAGFLRRISNTLRQEHIRQDLEPPKKGMLGGSKKNKNYDGGNY